MSTASRRPKARQLGARPLLPISSAPIWVFPLSSSSGTSSLWRSGVTADPHPSTGGGAEQAPVGNDVPPHDIRVDGRSARRDLWEHDECVLPLSNHGRNADGSELLPSR